MSIPSTLDEPRFITRQPAWEERVFLTQSLDTGLFRARAGLEQTQRRRFRAQWTLSYTVLMTRAELAARDLEAGLDSQAPLIVPFWTEGALIASVNWGFQVVTIDRAADNDWFQAGDWVYFYSPSLGSRFLRIDSVFENGNLSLSDVGDSAYTAGTMVFPCRKCIMESGRADWSPDGPDTGREVLKFATL